MSQYYKTTGKERYHGKASSWMGVMGIHCISLNAQLVQEEKARLLSVTVHSDFQWQCTTETIQLINISI
jgi:hypothetical protein